MNYSQVCSPPGIGGVAAPPKNAAKPPLKAQTGWSVADNVSRINTSYNDHPVCARFGCFAPFYYWRSHPSCSRRGTPLSCQFIHTFIDRRYVASPYGPDKSVDLYLNPAAFVRPATGEYGNMGRSNIQGP